jgi:hypothetical protein
MGIPCIRLTTSFEVPIRNAVSRTAGGASERNQWIGTT